MKELVEIKNNQIVVSSIDVAKNFGKAHAKVLRSITTLLNNLEDKAVGEAKSGLAKYFVLHSYIDEQGKERPCYLMNRDGFSLLVMGFTGKEALEWKVKYIQAFNAMEKQLKENLLVPRTSERELDLRERELNQTDAKLLLSIADMVPNDLYKETLRSLAVTTLTGKQYLPLPKRERESYSATELAKLINEQYDLDINSNILGRIANANNLKTEEYGVKVWDKAKSCDKQVPGFRYYDTAIEPIVNAYKEYKANRGGK